MESKTMGTRSISVGRAAGLKPAQEEAAPEVRQTATCCEGHLDATWLQVNHTASIDFSLTKYERMKCQPVDQTASD